MAKQRECILGIFFSTNLKQLIVKKTGKEKFPHVNLVLSICQLIVYLTILYLSIDF
jgi:hypothetical protein